MASVAPPAGSTFGRVSRDIIGALWGADWRYKTLMAVLILILSWAGFAWVYQIKYGMGTAGITHPVMWGVYITNFVFWVGIAHSGTLISAILYLLRSGWRTTINRAAEAMTIFAVMTAGLFPLIHLGRIWYFYFLAPYPNQRFLWPNFRSPLVWDFFAISTYFTISLLFWYSGLIPDMATIRDKFRGATSRMARLKEKIYGTLALGWQGSDDQWKNYRRMYLYMAAIATPLVLSVHSVVSWDFAMAITPGWHSTIFAPYFVAGAIFSGIAMVITLSIPFRWALGLEDYINEYHYDNMGKLMLLTSLIVGYAYGAEYFMTWYSGDPIEMDSFTWRAIGAYRGPFAIMVTCNVLIPLLLFSRRIRRNIKVMFVISVFVNIGMWYERFVIIVTSLAHEYLPGAWGLYTPSWVELSITVGSFAWFLFWFMIFAKTLPAISITEVKESIAEGVWSPGDKKEDAS
jgi:molybdopterin-containing oxidoreductase family membrane subunit